MSGYLAIAERVKARIMQNPHKLEPYEDLLRFAEDGLRTGEREWVGHLKWMAEKLEKITPEIAEEDLKQGERAMGIHRNTLRVAAPHDFDSFLLFAEWNREPKSRFYRPRRFALKPIVDVLQDLADDKLDILGISLPPGVGKSTLALFFLTFEAGRNPDAPMLTGSHSNSWIRGAYDECLRILDPQGEYLWHEAFAGVRVTNTNAKDCRIDLGKRKRFDTLEFTSIGTGNAGLYRASTLLYCDDLVSGLEVALSKERLDKLWEVYTTDLRQRKIGDRCKELHIATRWSVHDVIGRLEREYEGNPRARFISVPALNERDESNFYYPYNLGYSTKFLHEQRDIMDDVNWRALFMNQPIEREGQLYHPDELQRYFELPDREPDTVIAVCDTKDRGDDYCVMPIAYQYGQMYYLEEIICDNGNPDVVEERLVQALLKHKVREVRFESNSAGGRVAQKVQEEVRKRGGATKVVTKFTTANKETRIITRAGYVKDHFLFRSTERSDSTHREYERAMLFLGSYTMSGRNKHDDVPDALAMLVDYIESLGSGTIQVFQRPF